MEIGGMRLRDAARDTVFKKLPGNATHAQHTSSTLALNYQFYPKYFFLNHDLGPDSIPPQSDPFNEAESGGIIAITPSGEYSMEFNSKGMFRAICKSQHTNPLFLAAVSPLIIKLSAACTELS
jgi:Asparaginase